MTDQRTAQLGVESVTTDAVTDQRTAQLGVEVVAELEEAAGIYVDTIAIGSSGIGVG